MPEHHERAAADNQPAYWFVFQQNLLLIDEGQRDSVAIPMTHNLRDLELSPLRTFFAGSYNGRSCFAAEVSADTPAPVSMRFNELRPLIGVLPEKLFACAGTAFQLIDWDRSWHFCPRCAARLEPKAGERAKECGACGFVGYPPIAPAVIVAVVRDGKLLLATSRRFRPGLFSVLAGFVEAGETLEACVHREIREEVGIEVTDIKYFGSMSWPFPNSLMAGFTCRHASGEIVVDQVEIDAAGWYGPDELPPILPLRGTLSRKLIDWFLAGNR